MSTIPLGLPTPKNTIGWYDSIQKFSYIIYKRWLEGTLDNRPKFMYREGNTVEVYAEDGLLVITDGNQIISMSPRKGVLINGYTFLGFRIDLALAINDFNLGAIAFTLVNYMDILSTDLEG